MYSNKKCCIECEKKRSKDRSLGSTILCLTLTSLSLTIGCRSIRYEANHWRCQTNSPTGRRLLCGPVYQKLPRSLTGPKLLFCHHRNSAIIHFEPSAISSNFDTKYKYETGLSIFMSSFDNEGFFDGKVICDSLRVSVQRQANYIGNRGQ